MKVAYRWFSVPSAEFRLLDTRQPVESLWASLVAASDSEWMQEVPA